MTREIPFPALDGARQYSQHLVRLAAELSDKVDLLCLPAEAGPAPGPQGQGLPRNVQPHFGSKRKASVAKKLLTRLPHASLACDTDDNRTLLGRLLAQQPELVIIDHIGSSWALPQAAQWRAHNPAGVLWYATHNAERSTRLSMLRMDGSPWARPARTAAVLLDAWRIDANDRRFMAVSDIVSAITEADSESYRRRYGAACVVTLPPAYLGEQTATQPLTEARPRRLCLLGSFVWTVKKSNLTAFLRSGYALFAERGIEIVVAGMIEPAFRKSLESQWPKVRFTGTVTSIHEHLRDCRIGVVPEEAGGGFKLKLLDYVFNGLPVFALRHAVSGCPLRDDESAALYDDMTQLCRGIADRIDDLANLNRLQASALQACRGFLPGSYDATPLHRALQQARQRNSGGGPRG